MKRYDKLWGGRFDKEINDEFFRFQRSIDYDYRLIKYDIYHSMIHVCALRKAGILNDSECRRLLKALEDLLQDVGKRKIVLDKEKEDIHTHIQFMVEKKVGRLGEKLHTFRSRNDQIVFDEKLYCLEKTQSIISKLKEVVIALNILSRKYRKARFIGYTHTQQAQVIMFSDFTSVYKMMFLRDIKRLADFYKRLTVYIGAGALAGSGIDRECYRKAIKEFTAKYKDDVLKKIKVVSEPLDSVSDRDFIIELLSNLSIIQLHLSRLAEDIILYSTKEFSYLILPEDFCTGSSFLPHKKNPDLLELIRGWTGIQYGNLLSILVVMKGLPLSYNRDMQLDKIPLFSSMEIIEQELVLVSKFIRRIKLNLDRINEVLLYEESLYATALVEYLARKGVSFKRAHRIVGELIKYSEKHNKRIVDLDNNVLKYFSPYLTTDIIKSILNIS